MSRAHTPERSHVLIVDQGGELPLRALSRDSRQPAPAQARPVSAGQPQRPCTRSDTCLHLALAERYRRRGQVAHDAREPSSGDSSAVSPRAEAIRELALIVGFQTEVFDPVTRQWVPGFAVHSEFPRPGARALHAATLRHRGLRNEQIGKVLRVRRDRVSFLAWRGEGFLMSVAGATGYEEARRASLRRL